MDIVTTYKLSFSAKGGWLSKGAPLGSQTISRVSLHIYLRKISKKNHKTTHSDYITKRTVESADEPTGGVIQTTRGGQIHSAATWSDKGNP